MPFCFSKYIDYELPFKSPFLRQKLQDTTQYQRRLERFVPPGTWEILLVFSNSWKKKKNEEENEWRKYIEHRFRFVNEL